MKTDETILRSLLKGIVISCFLIFFHIAFAGGSSQDRHSKVIKFQTDQNLPTESGEEVKVSIQSSSLHSTGYIEICRETLYLFEVLFHLDTTLQGQQAPVPIPLSAFLQILFTSAISVNAP
jgi:hypothetical protein